MFLLFAQVAPGEDRIQVLPPASDDPAQRRPDITVAQRCVTVMRASQVSRPVTASHRAEAVCVTVGSVAIALRCAGSWDGRLK
jgi:hypothetical protein